DALFDGIFAHEEDNGDGRSFRFGRPCRSGAVRKNHAHTARNKIGRQCRKPIKLVLRPAKFDGNVAALNVAGFVEPFPETRQETSFPFGRTKAAISDHRHGGLRTRRERPNDCRTCNTFDELAPPHSITSSARSRMDEGTSRPSTALTPNRFKNFWK